MERVDPGPPHRSTLDSEAEREEAEGEETEGKETEREEAERG